MTYAPASTLLLAMVLLSPLHAAEKQAPAGPIVFEQHIRPLFKAYCYECHGEGPKLKAGLDLRLRRQIVSGGTSGPAIKPGQLKDSLLFEKIEQGQMPPGKKKLTREQIALIGRWIREGAKTAGPEPQALAPGMHFTAEDRAFWAWQPIANPPVPKVKHSERVRTPIDAFLLAKLEANGLTFAPEAERETLVRRVYFDLLGLPPTPEETSQFLHDPSPNAYEKLIDRLLASPHYGERWGRHWLDVAGYADSDGGSSEDTPRLWAWRYRDYVIRSFNADKPWDQFIQEQLAGDEMVKPPHRNPAAADLDRLIATGFLRMAPDGTGSAGVDQGVARNQVLTDTLKIVSNAFLGVTVACAQCHNHRYDPIPQSDFYQLRALFEPAYDWKKWRTPAQRLLSLTTDAQRAKMQQIEADAVKIDQQRLKKQAEYIQQTFERELAKLPEKVREPIRVARNTPGNKQSADQKKLLREHPSVNVSAGSLYLYDAKAAAELKKLADQAAALRATKPAEEYVLALTEVPGQVPTTYLFQRGDHEQPGGAIAPGGLTILAERNPLRIPPTDSQRPTSGRRLALARWLTEGKHPLTARVLVNRFWMHHFGRGLVATPTDFGFLGERPTHPELLDWLASDFMAQGWKLKRLHRLLLTSSAYRQSSRREGAKDTIDPENRLLGRMPVRRLEAEVVRDAMLAVSGKLNPTAFGKPVPVKVDEVGEVVVGVDTTDGAGRPTGKVVSLHGEEFRRSIYVQVRRSQPLNLLEAFDGASLEPNCELRHSSTVATQSLLLMNSRFVVSQAEFFAARVAADKAHTPAEQVHQAWKLALGRPPTAREVKEGVAFLERQTALFQTRTTPNSKTTPARQALASYCQALLSCNRFLYVD